MIHRFTVSPESARKLMKVSKRMNFYFEILSRTDHTDDVYCEVGELGYRYIHGQFNS